MPGYCVFSSLLAFGGSRAIITGAPVETTLRWPRTSVELQDGAAGARPASERPALAARGTALADAQLSGRRGSASGGSAARGFARGAGAAVFSAAARRRCLQLARPAIGGLGRCGERTSSSLCAASAHSGCGPLCGSRSESQTLSSACHHWARQRHFPTGASAVFTQPCGDRVRPGQGDRL